MENHSSNNALLLPLTEIAHLFETPRINPLSESPAEVLGHSGVDYLLDLLHQDARRQRARTLRLVLPASAAAAVEAREVTLALHRVAEFRIAHQQRELTSTCRYGWKVAALALIILALCISLSSLFTSELTAWMRP